MASLAPPQAIDWVVTHPLLATATASTEIEPLQPATLTVNPDPLSVSVDKGSAPVDVPVVIANAGQIDLHWSVTEALGGTAANKIADAPRAVASAAGSRGTAANYRQAMQTAVPVRASETAGCDAGTPGIQIQDDGIRKMATPRSRSTSSTSALRTCRRSPRKVIPPWFRASAWRS